VDSSSGQQQPSEKISRRLDDVLDAQGGVVAAAQRGQPAAVRTLAALSASQLDDLLEFLSGQWHALVKADNLLGPRTMRWAGCVIS